MLFDYRGIIQKSAMKGTQGLLIPQILELMMEVATDSVLGYNFVVSWVVPPG